MKRRVLAIRAVVFAMLAVAIWLSLGHVSDFDKEKAGFQALCDLAVAMIEERGPAVVTADGQEYISSFEAFFEYVKRRRPKVVSRWDMPNPFPGLLPEGQYMRVGRDRIGPYALLLWSTRIHDNRAHPIVPMQFGITCRGGLVTHPLVIAQRCNAPRVATSCASLPGFRAAKLRTTNGDAASGSERGRERQ
jgi:hypothetical protein